MVQVDRGEGELFCPATLLTDFKQRVTQAGKQQSEAVRARLPCLLGSCPIRNPNDLLSGYCLGRRVALTLTLDRVV